MDQSGGVSARIKEIDSIIPSPQQRATKIFNLLRRTDPDLSQWDLLCFCAEFLGMQSQTFHWLEEPAKRVAMLIYHAHYFFPNNVEPSLGTSIGGESSNLAGHTESDTKAERDQHSTGTDASVE